MPFLAGAEISVEWIGHGFDEQRFAEHVLVVEDDGFAVGGEVHDERTHHVPERWVTSPARL